MAPDARVHELMYVSDFGAASVSVYSYPAGKLEGHLRGVVAPAGECSDRSGNVFVTEPTAGKIREFAHGGTRPIAVLKTRHRLLVRSTRRPGTWRSRTNRPKPVPAMFRSSLPRTARR